MSNISLGGNTGTSINFDGAALQSQQEDEYRKEEEHQQNELRALLTNAFDDLIDEDDLSITSEDGTDSRNVSLVRRHSNDSLNRLALEENRIDEQPETENDWTQQYHTADNVVQPQIRRTGRTLPTINQPPRFPPFDGLSRTQELPRGQFDALRASVESLPNFPTNRSSQNKDNRGNPNVRSSRDELEGGYHSNTEDHKRKADFYGNVYPTVNEGQGEHRVKGQGHSKRSKGQKGNEGNQHEDLQNVNKEDKNEGSESVRSSVQDLNNLLRNSVENFSQVGDTAQIQEQFLGNHGNIEHISTGQGHPVYHSAEQPFDPDVGHGHYFPGHDLEQQVQNLQGHPHGYDPHFSQNLHQNHHHFRNIYHDRPYHTIGEREEAEGGNVTNVPPGIQHVDSHYYNHHMHGHLGYENHEHLPGYYGDSMATQGQEVKPTQQGGDYPTVGYSTQDHGFYSHAGQTTDELTMHQHLDSKNQTVPNDSHNGYNQGRPNERQEEHNKGFPNDGHSDFNQNNSNKNKTNHNQNVHKNKFEDPLDLSPHSENKKDFPENYKVSYQHENEEKKTKSRREREKQKDEDSNKSKQNTEKAFMEQATVGSGDVQQLAQLQILYKARGRKIEELTNEQEVMKGETASQIRILKHQLSVSRGEKEGSAKSLGSVQELLQEAKTETAQLIGKVHASESQIEGLKAGKEELVKKLQTAESTIESLHHHLEDLGSSDSLSRARHEHDRVIGGLQKKYETEIKHLNEKIDQLSEAVNEKDCELLVLKQRLLESVKTSELAQISRADTINRLTQSLEESQKRCRNLLESTSSQDMSQMKVQLQQALASKSISDEMCSGLQDDILDLKEQVQMLESASNLGVTGQSTTTATYTDQNDSMADLGIKKTLDFDTPQGTPTPIPRTKSHVPNDVVSSLKSELERCLISNKQKRSEVTDMKGELKVVKHEMLEYKQRCERAELMSQEHKKRIIELECCLGTGDQTNAIENRLKKDIDNLKREKKILLEDVQEVQRRLEEVSGSEEKLTDLNRELSKQISNMVQEYDQDKREALNRVQRACDQVSETSRNTLRQELTLQFDMERSNIITKYEKEINNLREELVSAGSEIDRVKDVYVSLCGERDGLQQQLDQEWSQKLQDSVQQVKEAMKKEEELGLLRAEENLDKIKEAEVAQVKSEMENRLKAETEQLIRKHEVEMSAAQVKFENEIKAIKDILEIEKSNDLEKVDKQKLNEIEKLHKVLEEKEAVIDNLKTDHASHLERVNTELDDKINELGKLRKELTENVGKMEKEKLDVLDKLKQENGANSKEVVKLNAEITDLKQEIIRKSEEITKLKFERERLENELEKYRKDEIEKDEVHHLRKEIDKNIQKDRQIELESFKKEVVCLKLEMERKETDKQNEIEKVCRVKQAEIQNLEKRRLTEVERIKKEKQLEIERLVKVKDEEISSLKRQKGQKTGDEEEILSNKVRERLNRETEEDISKVIESKVETKVAMSKVVWLEEHRATRQTAIDNAVRLAEAELKLKMEEDLENKLEKRMDEAKILWQSDSMNQLEDDRQNWDMLKQEEIEQKLQEAHDRWRQSELQPEIEAERQRASREAEERLEEERVSWREMELETEKLKWTLDWEQKLTAEKQSWITNILEPTKRKWKGEMTEKLRLEKDNWRCLELEPEKLSVMKECEERAARDKHTWTTHVLHVEIEKERNKWTNEMEDRLKREKDNWMNTELPKEIEAERNKWFEEVEEKLREERKNWKNSDLPEEIEKERKKWMKLLEVTLVKEKENWRRCDLPHELEKLKKELVESVTAEADVKLRQKLETETDKLQKESETKVLEAIEEHQDACKQELKLTISRERERLQHKHDEDLQERFQAEKKIWREMVDHELNQKLEIEREKWRRKSECDINKKLETEKEKLKSWLRADNEKRLTEETATIHGEMEKEYEEKCKAVIEKMREKFQKEAKEDFNDMKSKLESETQEDLERIKMQLEQESQMNLDKEKELMQLKSERELSRKLESEEENWKSRFEQELNLKLQKEEEKWQGMIQKEIEARLMQEKEVWEQGMVGRVEEEKTEWRRVWDEQKQEEVKVMREKLEERMRRDLDTEMEKFKVDVENEFHHRVDQEIHCAVEDARDDWHREYTMEMSINTTSAEASQGLLKEEMENLKQQLETVQSELIQKEEEWLKEKEDIHLQKDLERRKALDMLQDQTEAEYKQFITEHKDTLDKALKASRKQHNKEQGELEDRYKAQLKLFQSREKTLHAQLQESLHGSEEQSDVLAEFEKERLLWYEERDRLLQDISDRDSLLGKADVHLSKEVDKLRSELQAAYQRRLEAEMSSWKQKMEAEFTRANNSEQKEKLQLEKQLSEVNTEMKKVKGQLEEKSGEVESLTGEVEKLTGATVEYERKAGEFDRLEGELKKAKELLKGYKEELTDNQDNCLKFKKDVDDLQNKLGKAAAAYEKLQCELQKLRDEKSSLIESVQAIEASYRKDVTTYKHKQDEANTRIAKTEKILHDMKMKYRSELESLRKALEAENDVAMNAMKNKMIELQKKHVAIVDELKKRHLLEKEQIVQQGQATLGRGITPTPNTGEAEDIDKAVKELRSQYLDTVSKIKGDVIKHITQTNVRAAETVKVEMDKERSSTFNQIKDFYRYNVKQILETEIKGSNLESKLQAVEEALGSISNPSSRSTTPKSDEFMLDERQLKSRSRSQSATRDPYNRDAGISPKGQRTVSFTSGPSGDPRSPKSNNRYADRDTSFDDPRSPKSRMNAKSIRDANVTVRGDKNSDDMPDLRASQEWSYDTAKDSSFDTRRSDRRPVSAKSPREMNREESRLGDDRPRSAKSARELHISLRERSTERLDIEDDYTSQTAWERERGDKRKGRTLISTRDIHSGRYTSNKPVSGHTHNSRAKSTTPMYSSLAASSPSIYRPTSVPDLSNSEDKELKVWTENNNDTYRYTPLRDTLRSGTNLHRSNSKSESDLSIAEKNFGPLRADYDSNLDLSTGSLTSDSLFSPRKRDAGETPTPTATPRRHSHRKHFTMHNFPSRDQMNSDLRNHGNDESNHHGNGSDLRSNQAQNVMQQNDEPGVNSPMHSARSYRDRKNLPLIQFRHGKMQNIAGRVGTTSSKSPHPEEPIMTRDTPPTRDTTSTPNKHYRPLSVSSNARMDF